MNPQAGDPAGNLAEADRLIREAAQEGADLCVLPEMWPTSFQRVVDPTAHAHSQRALQRLADLSREFGLTIGGSAYGRPDAAKPSNRFHLFEDGREIYSYEKGHLFSPTAEHLSFEEGAEPPGFVDSKWGPMHGVVCYDLRFPEWIRPAVRAGSRMMLACAQWPIKRAHQWRGLAIARAMESQCPVIACNRRGTERIGRRQLELVFPGNSLIVGAGGEVLAEGTGSEELVWADLDPEDTETVRRAVPVWKDERTLPG